MPPVPTWFQGDEAIRQFLNRYPLAERWRHRPAQANGQLAVGCYRADRTGAGYYGAVIDVLTLAGDKIAAVTGFHAAEALELPDPGSFVTSADLFGRFGLPARLP